MEKIFLFDVLSKIYVATDSSPVDIQTYELCCDMIDVVVDISSIYGSVGFLNLINIIFINHFYCLLCISIGGIVYISVVYMIIVVLGTRYAADCFR